MQLAGVSVTTKRLAPTVASESASTILPNTSSLTESCAANATLPESLSLNLPKFLLFFVKRQYKYFYIR